MRRNGPKLGKKKKSKNMGNFQEHGSHGIQRVTHQIVRNTSESPSQPTVLSDTRFLLQMLINKEMVKFYHHACPSRILVGATVLHHKVRQHLWHSMLATSHAWKPRPMHRQSLLVLPANLHDNGPCVAHSPQRCVVPDISHVCSGSRTTREALNALGHIPHQKVSCAVQMC